MAATSYARTSPSSSIAAATIGFLPRVPTKQVSPFLALPYLPPHSFVPFLRIVSNNTEPKSISKSQLKASSTDEASTSADAGELLNDLKEKWDAVENKSTVLIYGGGSIVAIWLSSILVGAINSVPLLPKILELVGLGYTGWFVYRYLLFKSSRKELADDIESLTKKIAGTE